MQKQETRGTLTGIRQAESLQIEDQEVHHIEFAVETVSRVVRLTASSDEGTAFATLQNDERFRAGTPVIAYHTGRLCVGLQLDQPQHAKTPVETDIERLKDKAMSNLHLKRGELYTLLDAFDPDSVQAYAIARQLKLSGEKTDKVLAIADKDAVCSDCRTRMHVSPRHAYRFGNSYCKTCDDNVSFDLLAPIPTDTPKEVPSLDEIKRRLKERFGNEG